MVNRSKSDAWLADTKAAVKRSSILTKTGLRERWWTHSRFPKQALSHNFEPINGCYFEAKTQEACAPAILPVHPHFRANAVVIGQHVNLKEVATAPPASRVKADPVINLFCWKGPFRLKGKEILPIWMAGDLKAAADHGFDIVQCNIHERRSMLQRHH